MPKQDGQIAMNTATRKVEVLISSNMTILYHIIIRCGKFVATALFLRAGRRFRKLWEPSVRWHSEHSQDFCCDASQPTDFQKWRNMWSKRIGDKSVNPKIADLWMSLTLDCLCRVFKDVPIILAPLYVLESQPSTHTGFGYLNTICRLWPSIYDHLLKGANLFETLKGGNIDKTCANKYTVGDTLYLDTKVALWLSHTFETCGTVALASDGREKPMCETVNWGFTKEIQQT